MSVSEVLEVLPGLDVGLLARMLYLLKHLVVSEDCLFLHLHTKLHRMQQQLSWLGH